MFRRRAYTFIWVFIIFIHVLPTNAKSMPPYKDSGLYVSIATGISIPLGYFKSTNYLGYGGYAMNGYGGNLAIEHPIYPGWLGLFFNAGYYVNPFNLSAYEIAMHPYLTEYPYIRYYLYGGASPYKEVPLLGGVFFQYSYCKIFVDLKGMIGINLISYPVVNGTDSIGSHIPIIAPPLPSALNFLSINSGTGNSFCPYIAYALDATVGYRINKRLELSLNSLYMDDFLGINHSGSNLIPLSQLYVEMGLVYHF